MSSPLKEDFRYKPEVYNTWRVRELNENSARYQFQRILAMN